MSKLNEIARISAHRAWSNSPSDGWQERLDAAIGAYMAALPRPMVTDEMWQAARNAYMDNFISFLSERPAWIEACQAVLDHIGPVPDTRDA
jgi:hypothetical protein